LKISHLKSLIIKKSEHTLSEFAILQEINEHRKWKKYLTKKWYYDIMNQLLNKVLQIKNKKYYLINIKNKRILMYWKQNEKWACYIIKDEMKNVLWELHEMHNHYINHIILD